MNNLICATGTAEKTCGVHWGFLTIILVYLAFLCYWMIVKKHRELDFVSCVGTFVFTLIGFIMAFFACPICWIFVIIHLVILNAWTGYHLYNAVLRLIALKKSAGKTQIVEEPAKEPVAISAKEATAGTDTPDTFVDESAAAVNDDEETGLTLKESFSIMDALVDQSVVTKKSICNFLTETYGDAVIVNNRPNRTKNDRLPMADTHYVLVNGKKVCFVYVYENATGGVLLLVKTTKEHYKAIAENHVGVKRSAFPRRGEWYSIIVDDTYAEKEIYKILSDAIGIALDPNFVVEKMAFFVPYRNGIKLETVATIDASSADDKLSDDVAKKLIVKSNRTADKKKKGMINIGLIDQYFEAEETVTLEEIKKRVPGIDKKMTYCKLLANGNLTKALTVDLDDYSLKAVKMILLTGGNVITSR